MWHRKLRVSCSNPGLWRSKRMGPRQLYHHQERSCWYCSECTKCTGEEKGEKILPPNPDHTKSGSDQIRVRPTPDHSHQLRIPPHPDLSPRGLLVAKEFFTLEFIAESSLEVFFLGGGGREGNQLTICTQYLFWG